MVEKYIRLYIKRNIIDVFLVCVLLIFMPVLIASLHAGELTYNAPVVLVVLGIAVIGVLLGYTQASRFRKMIQRQEDRYGVRLSDTDEERLESMLYLSGDWLVSAGACGLYGRHIRSAKYRHVPRPMGGPANLIEFIDADGMKHAVWCHSGKSVDRIRVWLNERGIDL